MTIVMNCAQPVGFGVTCNPVSGRTISGGYRNGRPLGRSDAPEQAAKTALFAAANAAKVRKSAAGDFFQLKNSDAFA